MRDASGVLATDRLGVPSVASFALTAAAPLMVVGGYVSTAWAVTGTVAVSFALLIMAAVLAVWAVGYVTMARYVSNAGSLYTYVAHGFGPRLALAAAGVQLLAYSFLQVGLYGIAGVQAADLADQAMGLTLPWWTWAMLIWTLITILGTRGVGVSSSALAVAVGVELGLVAVIAVVDLLHPAGGQVSLAALDPRQLDSSSLGVALAISVTAFVGVEAAPVYSEESKRPRSTVLVATYLALGLMAVVYVIGSWAITVVVGPEQIVRTATELSSDILLLPASAHIGGPALVTLGHVLLLTSIGAGLLSYHNAVARCLFALGREHAAPAILGRTSPRTGAPIGASLAQSATGLIVILVYAVAGWDPMTRLFFALGTTGALGVLILLTAASGAVIGFFARDRRGETRWSTLLAPTSAVVLLGTCLCLVVANYGTLLGVEPTSNARWALPLAYLVMAALGGCYGLVLGRRHPDVLNRVGHGANAALADFGQLLSSETQAEGVR